MNNTVRDKRIVIAGGSGFVGVSLAHHLTSQGAQVCILSRSEPPQGDWTHAVWDGRTPGDWEQVIDGADGIVNLAGRSVDCIKTPDHRDEILRSRVESTRVLGTAMRSVKSPPPVWVQMSTAHIYGDPPSVVCDENSATGFGLAPTVAKAWEAEFADARLPDQRPVVLRTSFVVGRNRGAGAGAFNKLVPLARMGLAGRVGSGKQGISWIHEWDLNRLMTRGLTESQMSGVYIASAPHPVAQVEFNRYLRRAVGMPIGLPAYSWMVNIGARWILKTDPELALYGRYVVSERLEQEGFQFEFATVEKALNDLLRKK